MKGIGKGVRSFKEGMNGMEKEISPGKYRQERGVTWQRKTKRTA